MRAIRKTTLEGRDGTVEYKLTQHSIEEGVWHMRKLACVLEGGDLFEVFTQVSGAKRGRK